MPVSALDQHLKGICRWSAHPGSGLPGHNLNGRAARPTDGTGAAR
ncbi:hypothetical protein [Micromonospora nigra]|nr:hypothetical protein [Micromonospora nigra]